MTIFLLLILSINIGLSQSAIADKSNLDTLFNNIYLETLNNKYHTILGRDKDPKIHTDISKIKLISRKIQWIIATLPGLRFLTNLIYPKSTISHFNVDNAVAFTIDDGFCGADNINGCMINEVRELLASYNAHATFFVSGSHCTNISIKSVNELIMDGHEISNHNMMDWSYKKYSLNEFKFDLLLTKDILSQYNQEYSQWYRAPFGILTKNMQMVIDKENLIHVVSDAFANDTVIPDSKWIAKYILNRVKPGSIILIHMPEKDVREWNYEAIALTLKGLKEKKLKILNLSEISKLANQ